MTSSAATAPVALNTSDLKLKGFKVYAVDRPCPAKRHFSRRDYYKVILMTTKARLHYAHQSLELDGTYLFFSNPHIPYSMEMLADLRHGYICLSTEEFITSLDRSDSLPQSPLFKIGNTPLFQFPKEQATFMAGIFQKMLAAQAADYPFKGELIRTYLQLAIHEALHLQPAETFFQHKDAAARISSLFLELLEQLFPVESPQQTLPLKTAQEFADRLEKADCKRESLKKGGALRLSVGADANKAPSRLTRTWIAPPFLRLSRLQSAFSSLFLGYPFG